MTPSELEILVDVSRALETGNIIEGRTLLNGLLGSIDHTLSDRKYRVVRTAFANKKNQFYPPRHNDRTYAHLGHVKQFIKSNPGDTFEVYEGEMVWRVLPEQQTRALYPTEKKAN